MVHLRSTDSSNKNNIELEDLNSPVQKEVKAEGKSKLDEFRSSYMSYLKPLLKEGGNLTTGEKAGNYALKAFYVSFPPFCCGFSH